MHDYKTCKFYLLKILVAKFIQVVLYKNYLSAIYWTKNLGVNFPKELAY